MNRAITHLFVLFAVLFAVLVGFTSRWTVFEAESLENQTANRRGLLEEARIERGNIFARGGERLTRNVVHGSGEERTYTRFYPTANLFSHAVGYSFIEERRSGIEKFRNRALVGKENEFSTIFKDLGASDREGKDVRTALDLNAQRTAVSALGGRAGAVVVIEPSTGRVPVMASIPDYNPNDIPDGGLARLNRDSSRPLFNRATQSSYPPGSTFKVVTAAAALDSGRFTPDTVLDGSSPKVIGGAPLQNFGGQSFGGVSLTQALTNSVNTVWGQVGEQLGAETMFRYMRRFGFGSKPPIDYPREQVATSGVFEGEDIVEDDEAVDVGRVAIGQERLQVTPLQMAMVSAAVANKGILMEPRLAEAIVSKEGRRDEVRPRRQSRVMSAETAAQLGQMMGQVVREGSGTAGALAGISVAGKTGTAEVEGGAANQAWFIAFAPQERPRYAIAATVERSQGTGGEVAAPVARQVLEQLLGGDGG